MNFAEASLQSFAHHFEYALFGRDALATQRQASTYHRTPCSSAEVNGQLKKVGCRCCLLSMRAMLRPFSCLKISDNLIAIIIIKMQP